MDISSSLYLICVPSLIRAIDIWAIGSLFSEMLTGEPLFPGESDIDQLYLITKCFGVCACVCVCACACVCVWRACMCACVHACVWSVTSISTLFHMLISIFISIFMMTGHLIARHREIFSRNPLFIGMRLPEARELEPLERRYPRLTPAAMDIIKVC